MYTLPNTPEILTLFDEQNTRPRPLDDRPRYAHTATQRALRVHTYASVADAAAALGVTFEENEKRTGDQA